MRILVLSSKGRGTGCVLRARSIARAFERLGHKAIVPPPFPTLPFWLDMAFDKVWYLLAGFFIKADVAIGITSHPSRIPNFR